MNVYVCVWRESERVCVKESESTFLSVGVKHNASSHVSNKWVTRQTHSIGAFFIQEEIWEIEALGKRLRAENCGIPGTVILSTFFKSLRNSESGPISISQLGQKSNKY